jgi:protein-disulfide isomerase/rhodanese-related sulfurtransferase
VALMFATLTALGGFLLGRATADTATVATSEPPEPAAAAAAVTDVDAVPVSTLGDADAPVTMIEYSDFQCPYCQRYAAETLPTLLDRYVDEGLVRMEWRDFPALGPISLQLAVAGRAAELQGRFWDFHDAVFASGERITDPAQIRTLAQSAGLDLDAFDAAVDDPTLELAVRRTMESGQAAGVTGTPAFLVDGRPISGAQPLDVFVELIEAELGNGDAGAAPTDNPTAAGPAALSPDEAADLLADAPPGLQVVDVRTPEEIAEGTVTARDELTELDFYEETFAQDLLDTLDRDEPVLVYCRTGNRSGQTAQFLAQQGYEVYDLDGGITAWEQAGLPLS